MKKITCLALLMFLSLPLSASALCGTTLNIPSKTPDHRDLDYCMVDGADADGNLIHEKIFVAPKGGIGVDLAYLVNGLPHPVTLTAVCYDTAGAPSLPGEATCNGPQKPEFSPVKCSKVRIETDGITTQYECWVE